MDLQLNGETAVVTGGGSGIGRAIAKGFAAEGVNVAIWDVADRVADVAAEIATAHDAQVIGLRADITSDEQIATALDQTVAKFGDVDHLVHAAATGSGKFGFPFTNLSPDDWPRVLEINIMGMTRVAHAFAASMRERRYGTMTFIASVAGQIGSPTDPPYSATKAANINFAQCIAKDLAEHNVRVNSVCPGMVQTPLNKAVWKAWNDQQADDRKLSYEAWAGDKIDHIVPLKRWQQPADIADMVVFLASQRAQQVTGQTINVDGGFVMHS
jgi:2-hydroxycyclohexanecarboxyl-CoA dehydrogenase